MKKYNFLQKKLMRLGYPRNIVLEMKPGTEVWKEEMKLISRKEVKRCDTH